MQFPPSEMLSRDPPPPPPPSPPPPHDAHPGVEVARIGAIVGGVIGAIALILVAIGTWWWIRRRDARRAQKEAKTSATRDEDVASQRAATGPPPMYSDGREAEFYKYDAHTMAESTSSLPPKAQEADSFPLQIHELPATIPKTHASKHVKPGTAELSADELPQEKE